MSVMADYEHPRPHASRHEDGGADEIDVTGLTGAGATPHADTHEDGGVDEISVAALTGVAVLDFVGINFKRIMTADTINADVHFLGIWIRGT